MPDVKSSTRGAVVVGIASEREQAVWLCDEHEAAVNEARTLVRVAQERVRGQWEMRS